MLLKKEKQSHKSNPELDYKESWAPKNDAFELWCWRRLLRVPWTARRLNQSILKEINPKYSLEGLVLKLKLQYFDNLMCRTDSLEKTLMLGKIEGRRRRGRQRMRWLDGIIDSMDMSLSNLWEKWWTGKHAAAMGCKNSDMTEQPNNNNLQFGSVWCKSIFAHINSKQILICFSFLHF